MCQLPAVLIVVWSTAWRIYTAARIELETGGGSGVPPLGCAACGDRPRSLCGDGCHKAIQEASAKCAYGPPLIPNGICRVEFVEAERALVYPEKEAFTKFRRNLGIKAVDTTGGKFAVR